VTPSAVLSVDSALKEAARFVAFLTFVAVLCSLKINRGNFSEELIWGDQRQHLAHCFHIRLVQLHLWEFAVIYSMWILWSLLC